MTEDTDGDQGGVERTERRYQAVFNDPNILVAVLDPDGDLGGARFEIAVE